MQSRLISSNDNSFWLRVLSATTNTINHTGGWILNDLKSSSTWIWACIVKSKCIDGALGEPRKTHIMVIPILPVFATKLQMTDG